MSFTPGDEASMPEWLQQTENYIPVSYKDAFIDKSILSFLSLISRIRAQDAREDQFKINPFLRVFFTLMLIILISLSRSLAFVYLIIAYLMAVVCVLPGREIFHILRISLLMTLFTAAILIPAVFYGNVYSVVMIPVKVFASLMAVNLLSYSTRWDQITAALKRFWLPDLFIFVLDITLKYIVMLGEFSVEMLYALKHRSVGRARKKYGSISGVAGTLFLKSRQMSCDMYAAMECRGFTGEYHVYQKFTFGAADVVYLLINVGIVGIFLFLR